MALSIGRAWDETRNIIARDGKLMMVVAAALILLPTALANLINPSTPGATREVEGWQSLLELVAGLVMQVGSLAITAVALRSGTSVGEAIATGARKILPFLGAILLFAIPLTIVLLLAIGMSAGAGNPAELEARIAAGDVPPALLMAILLASILFIFLAVRLMLLAPVAVAETNNPVEMIKRSWALTRGHFWRLFGYLVALGIAVLLAMLAVSFVIGGAVIAIAGDPEPMNVAALLLGLLIGLANAAFVLVFATMSARIYAQLAAAPNASVPDVNRER